MLPSGNASCAAISSRSGVVAVIVSGDGIVGSRRAFLGRRSISIVGGCRLICASCPSLSVAVASPQWLPGAW